MKRDVVLNARNVGMTFNEGTPKAVTAIEDISFDLRRGEVVAIVGPSGCGKTTLFNIISGLLEPTRGSILIDGVPVHDATGHVGYMLQKDLLLPWRTVLENVIIGLEVRHVPRKEADRIARELISAYGLKDFENSLPSALSGGMRQRVAFMRTLAFNPDVILLDEPFSALDSQTRLILQGDMLRIIRERQCSVVLVTHDVGEAITMADRIVVITHRPGRVHAVHDIDIPAEFRHPLRIRKLPAFNLLYDQIWGELGIEVAA
ncbi:ABC transporter ATP-binding protein [Ramlibacter sp. Leaf400]|uniref:ABC transporter ATP-binding protein n=1 Tax=Ramlibacter sp. Leaf400 TaxID=1736365 RepID=UPI0006FEDAF7|nr:ABC transporter ATP-binding protein [Ramlibacter sp. Leaf400]KQT11229.1 spermidine/putrescine ABC transporter ATP-binding protein [Ramlibacter sp. Leaf400]